MTSRIDLRLKELGWRRHQGVVAFAASSGSQTLASAEERWIATCRYFDSFTRSHIAMPCDIVAMAKALQCTTDYLFGLDMVSSLRIDELEKELKAASAAADAAQAGETAWEDWLREHFDPDDNRPVEVLRGEMQRRPHPQVSQVGPAGPNGMAEELFKRAVAGCFDWEKMGQSRLEQLAFQGAMGRLVHYAWEAGQQAVYTDATAEQVREMSQKAWNFANGGKALLSEVSGEWWVKYQTELVRLARISLFRTDGTAEVNSGAGEQSPVSQEDWLSYGQWLGYIDAYHSPFFASKQIAKDYFERGAKAAREIPKDGVDLDNAATRYANLCCGESKCGSDEWDTIWRDELVRLARISALGLRKPSPEEVNELASKHITFKIEMSCLQRETDKDVNMKHDIKLGLGIFVDAMLDLCTTAAPAPTSTTSAPAGKEPVT